MRLCQSHQRVDNNRDGMYTVRRMLEPTGSVCVCVRAATIRQSEKWLILGHAMQLLC